MKTTPEVSLKRALRKVFKNKRRYQTRIINDAEDPYATDGDRVRYDKDGESWCIYGFRNLNDSSKEQIEQYFDDMREVIDSPYDCTGRPFTRRLSWHKNPSGEYSFVHEMALDI